MFTPIHRALGLEPGDVTWQMLEQSVEQKVEETADLDWKRSVYDIRDPHWQDEAAKDIAAMANSGGGYIVFGVAEDGAANAASAIRPVEWNADKQQRLLRAAYARIGPPVLGLEFIPVSSDGGQIVLLRVPDSPDAPHFARKGDVALVAPRRNGPHTVFMSDREIERGFRERFQQAEDRERELQTAFERAGHGINPEQGVCIVMAALPVEPVRSASPMSEQEVYRFTNLPVPDGLIHPGAQGRKQWDIGQVRKGLRQWLIRSDERSAHAYRKSLHDDGTVLSSYRLGALVDGGRAAPYYPVDQPNHCMSRDVEASLIDFLATLRAHATAQRVNAGFRVRVGLLGSDAEPIYVRTTEGYTNYLLDADHGEPIHHFEPVTSDLDPLEPVESILPTLNDLAQDIINQGGVKHLQVMAELDEQTKPGPEPV